MSHLCSVIIYNCLRRVVPPSPLPPRPFCSVIFPCKWYWCPPFSAAELKHGRIAQLAVVGFLLTQYVHLPGEQFQEGPLEALTTVPLGAQIQVFSCKS